MKKLLKIAISLTLVLATVFALASCSMFGGDDEVGEEFKAKYKKQEITTDGVAALKTNVVSKAKGVDSYNKYVATYKYKYHHTGSDLVYDNEYDVMMKVNLEAAVGEALAYIEFKSVYSQPDGLHGRDFSAKYTIVRISEGTNYSDYKVFLNTADQTFGATFDEMIDKIDEADVYLSISDDNEPMKDAFSYEKNNGRYFEVLYAYTMAVTGKDIISTSDNPFIYCLHEFNKDSFTSVLGGLDANSAKKGYKLFTSGDNMIKITRNSEDNQFFLEKHDNATYFRLYDDGTYAYRFAGTYLSENPARGFSSDTEQELKPLAEAIALPDWAK